MWSLEEPSPRTKPNAFALLNSGANPLIAMASAVRSQFEMIAVDLGCLPPWLQIELADRVGCIREISCIGRKGERNPS